MIVKHLPTYLPTFPTYVTLYICALSFQNTYPSTPIYQVLGEKGISCYIMNGHLPHTYTRTYTRVHAYTTR